MIRFWLRKNWELVLLVGLGVAIWSIFYPGSMSYDSLEQYRQARETNFDDWHPPLMSLVLAAVMKIGGDIQHLTLLQCLIGILGVRFLIRELLMLYSRDHNPLQSVRRSLQVVLFFLLPLTPFIIYLVTFWKDSWMLIHLLWGSYYYYWFVRKARSLPDAVFYYHVIVISVLWGVMGTIRHNSLIILPVVSVFLFFAIKKRSGKAMACISALLPIIISFVFGFCLNAFFNVKASSIKSAVKAGDIIGAILIAPQIKPDFPFTSGFLRSNYTSDYRFGDVGPIFWYENKIVREGYVSVMGTNPEVDKEYKHLVLNYPKEFILVKLYSFLGMIRPEQSPHWYFQSIVLTNSYDLKQNKRFAPVRRIVCGTIWKIGHHAVLRWVLALHVVWIIVAFGMLAAEASVVWRYKDRKALPKLFLLLVAIGYYSSYLLAATAYDHRLMYPATALVQIIAFVRIYTALVSHRPEFLKRLYGWVTMQSWKSALA